MWNEENGSESEQNGSEETAANRRAFEEAGNADDASQDVAADVGSQPPPFPHPPWTVGVVLILGGVSLLFGLLVRPIFLAVGSPFIIALFLWLYVKLFAGDSSS